MAAKKIISWLLILVGIFLLVLPFFAKLECVGMCEPGLADCVSSCASQGFTFYPLGVYIIGAILLIFGVFMLIKLRMNKK